MTAGAPESPLQPEAVPSPPARAGMHSGSGLFTNFISAFCFLVFPRQIVHAYTADRHVIALSVSLLFVAAVFQIFDSIQAIATGPLRGLGHIRTPMVWNLLGY